MGLRLSLKFFAIGILLVSWVIRPPGVHAFSLIGPPAPWMQATNNVVQGIGGPMELNSGYRWNVPVITYGFDQSFINYFGSNGVEAVAGAIQILDDLPAASQLNPTIYPDSTCNVNYTAEGQWLYDLKSETLSLLMSQLGLAASEYYTYTLKQWSPELYTNLSAYEYPSPLTWGDWTYPNYIEMLNFDPVTLVPTAYVNGVIYTAVLETTGNENYMDIFSGDPFSTSTALSNPDDTFQPGVYCTGLTYDDAGGLAYLYSTNNVKYEFLLSGIRGAGTNAVSWVNGAWRPGVNKLNIIPQSVDLGSGVFLPMTNVFTDTYITNGRTVHQQLQRVVTQPDILFSVTDFFSGTIGSSQISFLSNGTTNWVNNAGSNGNPGGPGPGIITPPAKITFGKTGLQMFTGEYSSDETVIPGSLAFSSMKIFGTFDGSTNAPLAYPVIPINGKTNQMILRLWLTMQSGPLNSGGNVFTWSPSSLYGTAYTLQTSTNLVSWVTLYSVTNNGSISTCYAYSPESTHRFYRLIRQ